MALFEKRPGAPEGTITVSVGGYVFVFPDATQVTVPDAAIDDLEEHPFVRLVPTGGEFVPAPVLEDVFLVDGVLSRRLPDGLPETVQISDENTGPVTLTRDEDDGTITSVTDPSGLIDMIVREDGRITSYRENGVTRTVTRDSNGRVVEVT